MAENVPSGVVELIIAVDLDPTNPEEPINVNNVDVRNKGEGGEDGGEDWKKLTMQLLEAAGLPASMSYEEAADAVSEIVQDDVEDESPFDKATKMGGQPHPDGKMGGPVIGGGMSGGDSFTRMNRKDDEDEE